MYQMLCIRCTGHCYNIYATVGTSKVFAGC